MIQYSDQVFWRVVRNLFEMKIYHNYYDYPQSNLDVAAHGVRNVIEEKKRKLLNEGSFYRYILARSKLFL